MTHRTHPTQVAKSTPFDNSTNGFNSTDTQSAIEESKQYGEGFPRAGIRGVYNGIVGNNNWLGPTELLPNTPFCVFAVKTKINEISWSNQTINVSFRVQFRSVSKTGTIFYTLDVDSPNDGYGFVNGLDYTFDAGSVVYAQYLDDGTNCSDMDLTLWVSRVPV
ncbi:MAG TPA: hypothetical protein VI911_08905 [Patescibacteria group bacterium]|nr:MAG: hypothetical protein UR43_C0005G0051 [candidate division TM6 bacterium GW2011_GWF2_33_332]HLD91116.1 hypothetical protein [Patescibacteria group bacterium]